MRQPPNLVTVKRDGKLVDAVAQITKAGVVFLFERATGKPLFPIEYREVEHEITTRDSGTRFAILRTENSVGQILQGKMRFGRNIDE